MSACRGKADIHAFTIMPRTAGRMAVHRTRRFYRRSNAPKAEADQDCDNGTETDNDEYISRRVHSFGQNILVGGDQRRCVTSCEEGPASSISPYAKVRNAS